MKEKIEVGDTVIVLKGSCRGRFGTVHYSRVGCYEVEVWGVCKYNLIESDIQKVTAANSNELQIGDGRTISRNHIARLLKLMDDYKPPVPEFQVGDFVQVLPNDGLNLAGKFARVVGPATGNGTLLPLEFAEPNFYMHDCDGLTKNMHGCYLHPKHLRKVE